MKSVRLAGRQTASSNRDALIDCWRSSAAGRHRRASALGLAAAHFLIADKTASGSPTRESQLRGTPDDIADWVLLVEGYGTASLRALVDGALSPETLERGGAEPGITAHHYHLVHLVAREDATPSAS